MIGVHDWQLCTNPNQDMLQCNEILGNYLHCCSDSLFILLKETVVNSELEPPEGLEPPTI